MSEPVRLGLVGAGRWGRVFIGSIADLDGIQLIALASSNPDAQSLIPAECRLTVDWRELLSAGEIDGLIIAVPPSAQFPIAEAAIKAGIPVLLEKPLSLDMDEASALRDMAASRDALVMVDHTHLYHPAYAALKAKLAELGGPGAVTEITAAAGNWGPFRADVPVLWDWGAHDVAMILDILGKIPAAVTASRSEDRNEEGGRGETLELTLEFGRTKAAVSLSNLAATKQRRLQVSLSDTDLLYDGVGRENFAVRFGPDVPWAPETIAGPLPVTALVAEFGDAIRSGRRDRSGLALGADVVSVLARLQTALDEGGPASI
ncbi:MAG: Gfo/Idh/MocA family oxidoreductase [Rhodospirillaceae bacterium]|jgi:predicted dehydrogenase|nr:Gfo/Idh/MocA family oxidoreductase [Rhodospirillaceae bacterium]MBT4115479.1 Gfo/Idh/MocA family oxidoreductase [Rhodospirillaceae bacterium]MBT4673570.1 Gfo/Idh/MocA family oxidoreductase [Rhodospirillaceae bacterium]MBT4719843.1 Gfo/Idh/MocA family oxidoreductase [Rhodospirillaceae bacterium]MBT4750407.1 Gfo/Idh/MocA family oxidoreductase [Rhodospirillaceae bacterium]